MTMYISLAISDTMFPDDCLLRKLAVSVDAVQYALANNVVVSALNPSHHATVDAIKRKFGIELPTPEKAPKIALQGDDELIVLQAQLPRLKEGDTHSQEVIDNAVIKFSLYRIQYQKRR